MAPPPPSRYQILGHLASGGMGEILLARRIGPVGFEKLVVLKRPLGAATRGHVTALIDEARLLARINHPNVCQVHDLEEGDAGYFLVLEHLEGMSLWTLIALAERAAAPPELAAVCGMVEQVCDGLDAIHGLNRRDGAPAGIVHRDISPGNLFLTETGVAKILDLGIAKTDDGDVTAPGAGPRGKLPYLSPEQVAGAPVDRRADVFSLGLVLYDLARGRRPTPQRVGALAVPDLALDGLPAPLAAVIRTAVAIDPAQRYATAGDLAAAIRGVAAPGGSLGRAELARWLAARFGAALAVRRDELRRLASGDAEPTTVTQRFELRSLVREAADEAPAAPGAAAPAAPATAELPPPAPLIAERAHPAIAEVQARIAHTGAAAPLIAERADPAIAEVQARIAHTGAAAPLIAERADPAIAEVEARIAHAGAAAPRRRRRGVPLALAIGVAALAGVAGLAVAAWWPVGRVRTPDAGERAGVAAVPRAPAESSVVPPAPRAPAESSAVAAVPRAPAESAGVAAVPRAPAVVDAATQRGAGAPLTPAAAGAEARTGVATRVERPREVEPAPAAPPSPVAPPPRAVGERAAQVRRAAGRLSIDSEPFAVIDLDGKPLGTTPLYQVQVAAGRHVLRAETGDGRVQRRAVEVTPGGVAAVVLRWPAP